MEIVILRCPRCGSELRRELPPDREFISAYCLCKNLGRVWAAREPARMLEFARRRLEASCSSPDAKSVRTMSRIRAD